jgi:3-phosphoshikimate 1-carboxyvinyltransferase
LQKSLKAIDYPLPMASAQVKSAILLAGLFAEGQTQVHEPHPSRDHTERMLKAMGVELYNNDGLHWYLPGLQVDKLQAVDWQVPGDPSSAAFPLVAALLVPDSQVTLQQVGLNPTRSGLFEALKRVGAAIETSEVQELGGEPVGNLHVSFSELKGDLTVEAAEVPSLVDEIPILAVAGLFLEGTLTVRGAEELRKKRRIVWPLLLTSLRSWTLP